VHALRRIHRSLRPDGVLVDLHPQPENTRVEVWQDGLIHPLGQTDLGEDIREILAARGRLELVERRGWFVTERTRFFEMLEHYPSVEDWMTRHALEGYSFGASEELVGSARHLLETGGGELIVREPIRASLLRRLPGGQTDDVGRAAERVR
jgi:hypothetical protein